MVSLSTAIAFYSVIGIALLLDEDRAPAREKNCDKNIPDPLQARSPCGTQDLALGSAEEAVAVRTAAKSVTE